MHAVMYIHQIGTHFYSGSFTVHADKDSKSIGPAVELELAFLDRKTAMYALFDAIEAHMKDHYGLAENQVTVEEI